MAGGPADGAGVVRNARRHVHARRHLGVREGGTAGARGSRRDGDRDDADRRFRGAVWMGLRRRQSVCALSPLRPAGRPPRVRRSRARRWPRRHSRCRLQPPRPGRQLPVGLLPRLFHRSVYTNDWGRAINFEGPPPAARSSSRTRATGSTSFISTGCAWMRRRTSRTPRASTCWRQSGGVLGVPPAAGASTSSRRTSRRTRGSYEVPSRAASGSTRSGTTTTITARRWR